MKKGRQSFFDTDRREVEKKDVNPSLRPDRKEGEKKDVSPFSRWSVPGTPGLPAGWTRPRP
jgi:hypothetical protein